MNWNFSHSRAAGRGCHSNAGLQPREIRPESHKREKLERTFKANHAAHGRGGAERFTDGATRKEWVMAMVKGAADTINYDIDSEEVSQLIDNLCDMTKKVNI